MGEPIWCRVQLRTPVGWGTENDLVRGLINTLGDYDEDDEWTIQGEGNYGLYDSDIEFWLDWMIEHKVPFIATSDAKYEYNGETRVFDGHTMHSGTSGGDSALLSEQEYMAIINGDHVFSSVVEFFEILNTATTAKFSIDHLPDKFPSDDDLIKIETPDEMPSIIIDGDDLVGTRADMLLLARTIHDVIEGADQ